MKQPLAATIFLAAVSACGGAPTMSPEVNVADPKLAPGPVLVILPSSVRTLVNTLDGPAEGPLDGRPRPTEEAIAVKDGKIFAVGSRSYVLSKSGPHATVIELPGAVIVPGFVDTHAHMTGLGRALASPDLVGTRSIDEVVSRLRGAPPTELWLTARGWDQNDWPGAEFPNHEALSAAFPSRPVALRRVDGHAVWVNREAMSLAGVNAATKDPEGGLIVRSPSGEPTGVFVDTAMALIDANIPPATIEQTQAYLLAATAACHRVGLTGVHDAGASAEQVAVMRSLASGGELNLRVHVFLDGDDPTVEPLIEAGPRFEELVSVAGVKLFADGALGSRGAWLSAPYSDGPTTSGLPIVHGEALAARVRRYAGKGFQVGVHAIGDAAATDVMNAFESVLVPGNERRFRIEHAQVVRPEDRKRMAALGVLAMVQPTHATSDMPWAEARLGPDRIRWAYAWRSLKNDGVRLALGSDFPVERPPVIDGLFAAVNRTDGAGKPVGGFYAEEALTALEALQGFTVDAAYAGFVDKRRGQIIEGFDADLTVLSADPVTTAPAELGKIEVLRTMVAGRFVYTRP